MKNVIKVLVLLAVASFPTLAFASIDSNLKYGQNSLEVTELQDFLVSKGLLNVSPTGFFGLLTLNAVKAYQTSVSVPNTGYVGNLTRAAINAELELATASSNEAEVIEVGTTTPVEQMTSVIPVVNPVVDVPVVTKGVVEPSLQISAECKGATDNYNERLTIVNTWKGLGESIDPDYRALYTTRYPKLVSELEQFKAKMDLACQ